jgi:mRNA interferase RelE/StbE
VIHDSKTIESSKEKLFRVRVGDYRILYEVDYNGKIIGIVKIDKRENAY